MNELDDRVEAPPLRAPARPFQLTLRALVVAGGLVAVALTRIAADEPVIALEVGVIALSLLCAATPDTHVGLLVVLLIGINWLVAVDDSTTPWVIGVAVAMALFHASMAAASVAPITARWTRAMRHRWARRLLVPVAATAPAWLIVAVVAEVDIGGSSVVMAGALLAIAAAGLWLRRGALRRDPRS